METPRKLQRRLQFFWSPRGDFESGLALSAVKEPVRKRKALQTPDVVDAAKLPAGGMEQQAAQQMVQQQAEVSEEYAAAGALNGRPCNIFAALQHSSNRRPHGAARRRHEPSAAEKLHMAERLERLMQEHASAAAFRRDACRMFGMSWKRVKKIVEGKEEWKRRVERLKVGLETRGGTCQKGSKRRQKASRGCRAPGAGRKDEFAHVKMRVKRWLSLERSYGHYVDTADLYEAFMEELEAEAIAGKAELRRRGADQPAAMQASEQECLVRKDSMEGQECSITQAPGFEGLEEVTRALTMKDLELKQWVTQVERRIARLQNAPSYQRSMKDALLKKLGAKFLKPSLLSSLSMEEEEARVKLGWMLWDKKLHTAAFGTWSELEKHVAPQIFMEHRVKTVIGMSDQIPVWVKIGRSKQVYCEEELQKKMKTADFLALQAEEDLKTPETKAAEMQNARELKAKPKKQVKGTGGSTLTRQTGDSAQDPC